MYPHPIRLRGPWEFHVPETGQSGVTALGGWLENAGDTSRDRAVVLLRRFNWLAPIDEDEVVWLRVERVVGHARVTLNGVSVGDVAFPLGNYRFDVTSLLARGNTLELHFFEPQLSEGQPNPYGSLGLARWGDDGAARRPLLGVFGGITLSVESRRAQLRFPQWRATSEGKGGRLEFAAELRTLRKECPSRARLSLELAGVVIADEPIEIGPDWNGVKFDAPLQEATSWQSGNSKSDRGVELNRLLPLRINVRDETGVVHDVTREVGFVDASDVALMGNDATPLLIDQTEALASGDGAPSTSNGFRVAGHVASPAFYERADREGWRVIQDVPAAVVLASGGPLRRANPWELDVWRGAVAEIANHPSVRRWRIDRRWDASASPADWQMVREALARTDPARPIETS